MEIESKIEIKAVAFNEDDYLVELMELLEKIDEDDSSAKANEMSMTDREGRRIYY
jgi:hypothetical protein